MTSGSGSDNRVIGAPLGSGGSNSGIGGPSQLSSTALPSGTGVGVPHHHSFPQNNNNHHHHHHFIQHHQHQHGLVTSGKKTVSAAVEKVKGGHAYNSSGKFEQVLLHHFPLFLL